MLEEKGAPSGLAKTESLHRLDRVWGYPSPSQSQAAPFLSSLLGVWKARGAGTQACNGMEVVNSTKRAVSGLWQSRFLGSGKRVGCEAEEVEKPCPGSCSCVGPGCSRPTVSLIPWLLSLLHPLCQDVLDPQSTSLVSPCMLVCSRPGRLQAQ